MLHAQCLGSPLIVVGKPGGVEYLDNGGYRAACHEEQVGKAVSVYSQKDLMVTFS